MGQLPTSGLRQRCLSVCHPLRCRANISVQRATLPPNTLLRGFLIDLDEAFQLAVRHGVEVDYSVFPNYNPRWRWTYEYLHVDDQDNQIADDQSVEDRQAEIDATRRIYAFDNRMNDWLEVFCRERDIPMLAGAWLTWNTEVEKDCAKEHFGRHIFVPKLHGDWYFIIFDQHGLRSMDDPGVLQTNGRAHNARLKSVLTDLMGVNPKKMHWTSKVDTKGLDVTWMLQVDPEMKKWARTLKAAAMPSWYVADMEHPSPPAAEAALTSGGHE
jgi:hypothetical protein